MQKFPIIPVVYDFSNLNHPLSLSTTPPFTIQKVEWESQNLKITFAESINYGNNISNIMYFFRFAENANGQYFLEAEAFFYFINKLNQRIQIPIRRTWKNEQNFFSYWALSDEVIEEIKTEKSNWNELGYTEQEDFVQGNKTLIDQEIRKSINAQKYLNQKYPVKEQRKNIMKIDLSNQNLEGDLNLTDFSNLVEINITGNPQLGEIIKHVSSSNYNQAIITARAQDWLNWKYPNKREKKADHSGHHREVKVIRPEYGEKIGGSELTIDIFLN